MAKKKTLNTKVSIGRLKLKNPVMTAAGTFGYGEEYSKFLNLNNLGAIVVKGLSLLPKQGNPPTRIVETPAGMLNAIGLQNIGIENFIKEKLPFLRQFNTPVIVNFFGDSIKEYAKAAERLSRVSGIQALEMNISCPNRQAGWSIFGTDPKVTSKVVKTVRNATDRTLIVKLSPNVTDISLMARVAEDAGADAVSLINTITGMAIDIRTRKPKLANITGGLSGPAVRPVAVRMVWECSKAVNIPIIGMGGIISAEDALEFIMAGASAVAVGTANFVNPRAAQDIIAGIRSFMSGQGIHNIKKIIGGVNA
ncbi:MAG TPA: dihydroorotate dehydrogenase [Nitrospirae bacterium]|nr:dihydroorotate dehydrogenase B (NAD(+)), catalytic subunit [bacterium BMS3Abin10]GBE38183.1 dihydroorotate dehydrogenase B (NAD(+)), catalytic subunit [bacterium BMS3Bbin08]HDH51047.1 dihydroorotate dehydrogenase [Nitrospirota bacterium]HDO25822.1 dihydroorotate dehydrogenase [Nitrospirota bacterium]HDZ84830.1 dihydroorotate dehydrogenase [Nitrospirota bacterium]